MEVEVPLTPTLVVHAPVQEDESRQQTEVNESLPRDHAELTPAQGTPATEGEVEDGIATPPGPMDDIDLSSTEPGPYAE